jgi:hypothetical protein
MTPTTTLSSSRLNLIPSSVVNSGDFEFAIAQLAGERKLAVLSNSRDLHGLEDGEASDLDGRTLLLCPFTHANADFVRSHLPWTTPTLLGLKTSAGMGDRIGLATPGHINAVRETGCKVAPILAQQSIREMTRTGRSPEAVMDDALWGVLAEGWQSGFGADADHLKTAEDIDLCLKAGFTFFTIDPGLHVDNRAETADPAQLRDLAALLPNEVAPSASGLAGKVFDIEGKTIEISEMVLLKAAVKYGRAVAHVAAMYRHLINTAAGKPVELEVSVDETEQPTTPSEHIYIASELKRLGVKWSSLAPRFVGRFEKGVDYIGDLSLFEKEFIFHAAIARAMGPYKISLHSGSDKFSIYPIAMHHTRGLVHLKTAGTSYLEALRAIAVIDPEFFKQIYSFAREHYTADKASYHVSAELERAPQAKDVIDCSALLDQFDAREILHVTFGSVLTDRSECAGAGFYPKFMEILRSDPEIYKQLLTKHFVRHLTPFSAKVN